MVVKEPSHTSAEYDSAANLDTETTCSETASTRDAVESMRSEQLLVELEELSKCRAAVLNEVDLSEVPNLEEVDAREALHQELAFQRVAAMLPDNADAELDACD